MPDRSNALLDEAKRQLGNMRSSRYQHTTRVNEATGDYRYDCSGFMDYALKRVAPDALAPLPHRPGRRPQAKDFVQLFGGPGSAQRPWRAVASAAKLRPGHILAWLRPSDADENNDNTGHVMIVAEAPSRSPTNGRELLIRVIDSTRSPHADDSRSARQEGLGTGTVGLVLDEDGAAIGYRWRGGRSRRIEYTTVALGRLGRPQPEAAIPLTARRRRAARAQPAPSP